MPSKRITHVTHMGWQLELAALRIVKGLAWVPEAEREALIEYLAPKKLRDAVREMVAS